MQTLATPKHWDLDLMGTSEILRPFVGFFLFCIGKLLLAVAVAVMQEEVYLPNFTSKPFSMYLIFSLLFLSPLGLHFFMAYQEFFFYTFCSFHRTCVNRVLETSEEEVQNTRIAAAQEDAKEQNNAVTVYNIARGMLQDNLKELVEVMKNMTDTFGPFLLQNLTMMLLFWLMHVYLLIYFLYKTVPAMFGNLDFGVIKILWGQLAGLALVAR